MMVLESKGMSGALPVLKECLRADAHLVFAGWALRISGVGEGFSHKRLEIGAMYVFIQDVVSFLALPESNL